MQVTTVYSNVLCYVFLLGNRALQEMKLLRKKFPSGSISGSLRKCKEDKETDKLGIII